MIRFIILFIFISSCSIKQNGNNLEKFDYDQNLSIEKFKKKLINYGKASKYPDINK
tara:strand:- start:1323 stop:1490 length:168 start_codon:yes stop_codon:yes gene_type:complete